MMLNEDLVYFISFLEWILFHYMAIWHFVSLFICQWTFRSFPALAIVNNATVSMHLQIFVWVLVINSFGSWYNFKRDLLRTIPNLKSSDCQFSEALPEITGLVPTSVHGVAGCGTGTAERPQVAAGGRVHPRGLSSSRLFPLPLWSSSFLSLLSIAPESVRVPGAVAG